MTKCIFTNAVERKCNRNFQEITFLYFGSKQRKPVRHKKGRRGSRCGSGYEKSSFNNKGTRRPNREKIYAHHEDKFENEDIGNEMRKEQYFHG